MEKTQGIDVSHYQGNVDWNAVKAAGCSFGFAKCTGGLTFNDPRFEENWKNMAAASILRGAYHFYYNSDTPGAQVEHFLEKVGPLSSGDLPPMLDAEGGGFVDKNMPIEQYQQDVLAWLKLVESKTGRKPILYTGASFGASHLNSAALAEYPLWIAEYGVSSPTIPSAWDSQGWTFWQNESKATISGIEGTTDHDIFNGTLAQLQQL